MVPVKGGAGLPGLRSDGSSTNGGLMLLRGPYFNRVQPDCDLCDKGCPLPFKVVGYFLSYGL